MTNGVPGGPGAGAGVPGGPTTTGSTTSPTDSAGGSAVPGGSVPPAPVGGASAGGNGLSPGEIDVLRKIASDADFRLLFATDPIAAITGAGLQLTTEDFNRLERLDAAQLEQVATAVNVLVGTSAASGLASADGTHTLLWAIVVALVLAAEPTQPTEQVAIR